MEKVKLLKVELVDDMEQMIVVGKEWKSWNDNC